MVPSPRPQRPARQPAPRPLPWWRARWLAGLLLGWLLGLAGVQAATYTFPGSLPAGCSGSGPAYSCTSLTLGYNDVVVIAGTKPATITVNGNLVTDTSQINAAGQAGELNLVVTGTLQVGYQAVINAQISAGSVTDASGAATYGGSVATTTGSLTIGWASVVNGSVSSTSGAILLNGSNTIYGDVRCTACTLTSTYLVTIHGSTSVAALADTSNQNKYRSPVTVAGGSVGISQDSLLEGHLTAPGAITLANNVAVKRCLRSTGSGTITLGSGARAGAVCCGALGSCSSSCVVNNSGASMPPLCTAPASPALVAEYRMEEASWSGTAGEITDSSGNNRHGVRVGSATTTASGQVCRGGDIPANTSSTSSAIDTGLDLNTAIGNTGSISFWYRGNAAWNSGTAAMLFDATTTSGKAFFLQKRGDGTLMAVITDSNGTSWQRITSAYTFPAGTWVHVALSWEIGHGYITIGTRVASSTYSDYYVGAAASASSLDTAIGTLYVGDSRNNITGSTATINSANGRIDELRLRNTWPSVAEIAADAATTRYCVPLHHVEIRHGSGSGVTCTPNTLTVTACEDAACTTSYTGGLSGSLTATGGTVNWPAGAAFSIAAGSSSTTLAMHQTSVGTTLLGTTGLSMTPSSATTCNFGAPGCTFTAAEAGLLFDVPDQLAETSVQVTVRAVKKSDSSLACTPALANVTRSVTFRCSYSNPATGTLPVRIGGTALNAAGSASAACDGSGRAVSLGFDGTGTATTSARYADAGRINLTATYTGSGSDAGLTMTGSDSFVSAPFDFAVSGLAAGPVAAGSATTATVTARNYLGNTTPNFGRESPAESVSLGFVRQSPTGTGAVSGTLSGTVGSFSNGVASSADLAYTEVGQIDVVATLASTGYLGSAYRPAGSSHGAMVWCADEWSTCTLPAGTVNTVWYANYANGAAYVRTGVSTSIGCTNAVFGDPWVGSGKGCWYVSTSGVHSGNTGALTLRPHRFELSATAACPAGNFTYAGQPYSLLITARNAAGATTVNYDGSAATSPNQARAVTLAEPAPLGLGTLGGASVAASAFTAGVASASPSYSFTAKLTAPQSLVLRATDAQGVSSAGTTEPAMPLRSGRLRLSNAFGKASTTLALPVTAEYWGGSAWVVNSADACTTVPASAVALSNPRGATGAATATSTSVSAGITLSAGRGSLTLAAPSPANASLTVDLALNLGSTAADQSCLALHPATTGAARPWLRSSFGSCAATADRDPAARASFGVFSPESRKTVHLRELF